MLSLFSAIECRNSRRACSSGTLRTEEVFVIGLNFEASGFGIVAILTSRHEFGVQPSDSDLI